MNMAVCVRMVRIAGMTDGRGHIAFLQLFVRVILTYINPNLALDDTRFRDRMQ